MIVMLTALEVEYRAVRAHLSHIESHPHEAGTRFEVGTIGGHETAIALTGVGNAVAATLTERAIGTFTPDVVLFVGVAGGLRSWLELGEVVVASRVYGYHGGRQSATGFDAHPRAWETPYHVEQLARSIARAEDWCPNPPRVHFEPVAAGEVVLNSSESPLAKQINHHYNDAVAIEMESAGVANAAHLNMATPAMTVRGISDHVDDKDATDAQGWQSVAAANAAAFAAALVAALPQSRRSKGKAGPVGEPANNFHNYGNVGTQIGTNSGFVHSARDPLPRERIEALTAAVVHAHNTGQVDSELFNVAMVTLDGIRNARHPDDLDRLRALLGNVPALRLALGSLAGDQ